MTDQALVVWLDAQLSPAIAGWMQSDFGVAARPIRELGLRDAEDPAIFAAAGAVVMTKDCWLTCGNTSNARLRELLQVAWPRVVVLLKAAEALIEISDPAP